MPFMDSLYWRPTNSIGQNNSKRQIVESGYIHVLFELTVSDVLNHKVINYSISSVFFSYTRLQFLSVISMHLYFDDVGSWCNTMWKE